MKLSHEKESGYNVRYYSFSLSFIGDGGTPTPTTYTVTYDCNGGTSGCPENVSGIEPGTTITLADSPVKENYLFAGWNDGENTYDEGDEYEVNGNVTFTAEWDADPNAPQYEWVLTDLANLSSSDVFVIVGNNGSNFAMANDGGTTSAPSAVAVTVANNKVTSAVADNIKWNISGDATDGYVFYPNGNNAKWLYCTNDNNGVRVGTNTNTTFKVVSNYLQHQGTSRYVGVYNSTDWRCYTSINQNIQGQTFAFYKRQVVSTDPAIYASNVNIAYNDLQGQIEYTLENEVTGGELTASTTSDWLTLPQTFASPIAFTATKNTVTEPRTATVTLNYVKNGEVLATKDVMVTQGAHPTTYTTIEALFNAAGSTATEVFVTFGGWVVSGVSTNGYNVFVTDGTNGFVINGGNHGFEVGNTLTSATPISCTLQKSNGYAKVTGVNASTEDLTVGTGGTATVADIAMANLAGINTGALVSYENLTCSVDNSKYYLTDGTTTLQVYTSLYDFTTNSELTDGKTYNITGVYQQYSNTKEILPRSADDIVEVEVQHEEYTLTVSDLSHVNLFIFGGDESETIISTEDGQSTAQVYDGTEVLVSIDVETGYVFQSLTITNASGTPIEPEELTANEYYKFTMPTSNVTITATAVEYVAPTGDQYELYSGALEEGDYIIYYEGYAMNHTVTNGRLQYETVTPNNNVITTSSAEIVWHIAPSGNYWTIYSADAQAYAAGTGVKNKAQMLTDGTDDKALWSVTVSEAGNTYEFANKANVAANVNNLLRNNGTNGFACYASTTGGALSLYKKVETTPSGYTLEIAGFGIDNTVTTGWNLIASPVTTTPEAAGMITNSTYDLYYYDQNANDGLEWINYKNEDGTINQSFGNIVPGKGYLYANSNTVTLTFDGTPYDGDGTIEIVPGWNLIGNPFGVEAAISGVDNYYALDPTASELSVKTYEDIVAAMQGLFVYNESNENSSVDFIPVETEPTSSNLKSLALNVTGTRGNMIDRAIVRFGEGHQLPKFQLNKDNTKIYFAQADNDYAVVSSDNEGEMPVSFKAAENGTYTISFNAENTEMRYMHLIDNMTGNDIDLLATPSYSFEAKTTDYASRFRLVFSTGNADVMGEEHFAFYNGSEWVIISEGEATLQVIDMTGRVLTSETINGNANVKVNQASGVYVMRLIQNGQVRSQKIVKD